MEFTVNGALLKKIAKFCFTYCADQINIVFSNNNAVVRFLTLDKACYGNVVISTDLSGSGKQYISVPSKTLYDILSAMKKEEIVKFKLLDTGSIEISCGNKFAKIDEIASASLPREIDRKPEQTFSVPAQLLKESVEYISELSDVITFLLENKTLRLKSKNNVKAEVLLGEVNTDNFIEASYSAGYIEQLMNFFSATDDAVFGFVANPPVVALFLRNKEGTMNFLVANRTD